MSRAVPRELMEETANAPQSALAALIEHHTGADGIHATAIPRLFLIRSSQPTEPFHVLHEPALCRSCWTRPRGS